MTKNLQLQIYPLPLRSRKPLIPPHLRGGLVDGASLEVSKSPASLKSQNIQNQEKANFSVASLTNAKI